MKKKFVENVMPILRLLFAIPFILFVGGVVAVLGEALLSISATGLNYALLSVGFGAGLGLLVCLALLYNGKLFKMLNVFSEADDTLTTAVKWTAVCLGWVAVVGACGYFIVPAINWCLQYPVVPVGLVIGILGYNYGNLYYNKVLERISKPKTSASAAQAPAAEAPIL